MRRWITAAAEGLVDEAAIRRLAREYGLGIIQVHTPGGKHQLDRRLTNYNAAAQHAPWLVLRDLDHDADCPPELIASKLPDRSPNLQFRIVVRSLEAWLLADSHRLSRFLAVPETAMPLEPELLDRPKRTVVDLARRSRRREIRDTLVPDPGLSIETGPGYSAYLIEFINEFWTPSMAAERSESLRRCMASLAEMASL